MASTVSRNFTLNIGRAAGASPTISAVDSGGVTDSLGWVLGGTGQVTGAGITRVQDLTGGHLSNATTGVISFPAGAYTDGTDFNDLGPGSGNYYGYYLPSGVTGIIGTGIDSTLIEVAANTMSVASAAAIPAQSTNGTNPLTLIRFDNGGPTACTIKGTTQVVNGAAQLYNGVQYWFQSGTTIPAHKTIGIPGDNSSNPGETFGEKADHAASVTFNGIEVDGTDGAGTKVGGTGFGLNSGSGTNTFNDCSFHDMGFGHGVSAYKCVGQVDYNRVSCTGSPGCFNYERNVITSTLDHCNFASSKTGTNHSHMIVDGDLGSSVINIVEPSFDTNTTYPGQFVVCIHATYPGGQQQLATDIHLTLGGVTYTPTASANYNQTGVGSFGPLRIVQHGAFG